MFLKIAETGAGIYLKTVVVTRFSFKQVDPRQRQIQAFRQANATVGNGRGQFIGRHFGGGAVVCRIPIIDITRLDSMGKNPLAYYVNPNICTNQFLLK